MLLTKLIFIRETLQEKNLSNLVYSQISYCSNFQKEQNHLNMI